MDQASPFSACSCPDDAGRAVWEAIVHDCASDVFVLDADGQFHFANEHGAQHLLGPGGGQLQGRTFADLFSPEFCRERLGFMHTVFQTGRPLTVRGMCRGVWTDCTMRALPIHGQMYVLIVSRLPPEMANGETESNPSPGVEIVHATVPDLGVLGTLTQRELEVLKLIGEGLSTAAIGKRLYRSQRTVQWHRVTLGKKLGVTNRVELARIAIAAGLTRMPLEGLYQHLRVGKLPPAGPRPTSPLLTEEDGELPDDERLAAGADQG